VIPEETVEDRMVEGLGILGSERGPGKENKDGKEDAPHDRFRSGFLLTFMTTS
jgi:hypothetical protein